MSTLLVAVNSRFSHTNLAVRSITNYVKSQNQNIAIQFDEFTISEPILEILKGITDHKPSLVIFSVYIWNCSIIYQIAEELKKIRPNILLGAGGPEVSYKDESFLKTTSFDFIVEGEGELTTLEICKLHENGELSSFVKQNPIIQLQTFNTQLITDLSVLPFPYPEFLPQNRGLSPLYGPPADSTNRILYYESSRGCPFNCSYCLSSIDKTVRFMPLYRVFEDLQIFLDAKVKLVKFVDRTFNLNEERYIQIWQYIKEHYNGITLFHFEIAAECLSEKAIKMIPSMPKNSIQFEIGVQSTNPKTLAEVGRKADLQNLKRIIDSISPFVHTHLDLIAGLPFESLTEFKQSFDFVFFLKPAMLQLGFLKILDGTKMAEYANEHNFKRLSIPPYEVLETPNMSWEDLLFLKKIEKLNDAYWNSGTFSAIFEYLLKTEQFSPFNFYKNLLEFALSLDDTQTYKNVPYNTVDSQPHKTDFWFSLLVLFFTKKAAGLNIDLETATELLKFDYLCMAKTSTFPEWLKHNYNKDNHHKALQTHTKITSTRLAYANSTYEEFSVNPFTYEKSSTSVLFLYDSGECKTIVT